METLNFFVKFVCSSRESLKQTSLLSSGFFSMQYNRPPPNKAYEKSSEALNRLFIDSFFIFFDSSTQRCGIKYNTNYWNKGRGSYRSLTRAILKDARRRIVFCLYSSQEIKTNPAVSVKTYSSIFLQRKMRPEQDQNIKINKR